MGMISLLFLAAAVLAQPASEEPNLSPYLLRMKGETEVRHVLADPSSIGDISYRVVIDEPWAGSPEIQIQRMRVEEIVREEDSVRKRRIEDGWRAHGGVSVTTRAGETIWVLAEDKKWADKAQAIAREAYGSGEAGVEPVSPPEERSRSGPGFARLWAPHAAVIAAALALMAGVYFFVLRRREQWSALDSGNRAPRRR